MRKPTRAELARRYIEQRLASERVLHAAKQSYDRMRQGTVREAVQGYDPDPLAASRPLGTYRLPGVSDDKGPLD